ncbi:hypothetical protein [Acanthopleuribacter pedis]|uniref:Uncharacterized protein n=1 Tax=Acanthopleuribacter pedis TaxID=442870 RepID=A0A8J7QV07_9BACT|nr:hypothetical protein [Acanthopleuribacter pedis]MBO1323423.1 hypothetical protein [Acanthopleuribacter pedis]
MTDRILFPTSPWPQGHIVTKFAWSGRLEPDSGLWFDLHLESDDYFAVEPTHLKPEAHQTSNWDAPAVWGNYGACTLSSVEWGEQDGFRVGTPDQPFDINTLENREFWVDRLGAPADSYQDPFRIYLQGFDSVADMRIQFGPRHTIDRFGLTWEGRIALTYRGDDSFRYRFETQIQNCRFEGFYLAEKCTVEAAWRLFRTHVTHPEAYTYDGWTFSLKDTAT